MIFGVTANTDKQIDTQMCPKHSFIDGAKIILLVFLCFIVANKLFTITATFALLEFPVFFIIVKMLVPKSGLSFHNADT